MSLENWKNYKTSVEDYRSLNDHYDLRFELIDGTFTEMLVL
jgi:hypothetical protein